MGRENHLPTGRTKTRLRQAYVAATLSGMPNLKLGRAKACEGGLSALGG